MADLLMAVTVILVIAAAVLAQLLILGRYCIGPLKRLGEIRVEKLPGNAPRYDMHLLERLPHNPLEGRHVVFLGSSVTYGAASLQQGIPEYFAARLGCDYTKEAVSGTTLVDNGPGSYVRRLEERVQVPRCDLLICQLSTNDATKGLPLGDIAPGEPYDTATVTGAMEHIIAYARARWGCPVVFYTGSRYESKAYKAMVARLQDLREKWGIGILDLWSSDAFNRISQKDRALYMNDPIHPTKAGYKLWWCPELERQLLEYLREDADAAFLRKRDF